MNIWKIHAMAFYYINNRSASNIKTAKNLGKKEKGSSN